jgi:putative oxidoreductase
MSDVTTTASAVNPLDKLANKLSGLVPPPKAATLAGQHSPAVEAALKRSAIRAAEIARRTRRSHRSFVRNYVDRFINACAFVPYSAVALLVRLVIARVFFLAGQTMIDGPRVPLTVPEVLNSAGLGRWLDFSVTLPVQVKAQTFTAFATQFSTVPLPPVLAAYLVSYAQFILPLFLVIGFATRLSAVGLLVITATIQLFVFPEALWTTHIYWAALLAMLISMGPGVVSIDHVIRWISRR